MEIFKTEVISSGEINFSSERYNNTKVKNLECFAEDKALTVMKQPTTWAGLIRTVLDIYRSRIDDFVETVGIPYAIATFNEKLKEAIAYSKVGVNYSYKPELFRENSTEHISSTIYQKSYNKALKIFYDKDAEEWWCITAVYTGEIIWLLNALVNTLNADCLIRIQYRDREKEEQFKQMSLDEAVYETGLEDSEDVIALGECLTSLENEVLSDGSVVAKIERLKNQFKAIEEAGNISKEANNYLKLMLLDIKQDILRITRLLK